MAPIPAPTFKLPAALDLVGVAELPVPVAAPVSEAVPVDVPVAEPVAEPDEVELEPEPLELELDPPLLLPLETLGGDS